MRSKYNNKNAAHEPKLLHEVGVQSIAQLKNSVGRFVLASLRPASKVPNARSIKTTIYFEWKLASKT